MTKPPSTRFTFPDLPHQTPPIPASLDMDTPVVDLVGLWLELNCECSGIVLVPLRLVAAQQGWQLPIGSYINRLKCSRCGKPPSSIVLLADPAGAPGPVAGRVNPRLRLRP